MRIKQHAHMIQKPQNHNYIKENTFGYMHNN